MSEVDLGGAGVAANNFQIGAIVPFATTVTDSGHSLLKCDGSEYSANDYPVLASKISGIKQSSILTKVGDGIGFTPLRVLKSADGSRLLAWNGAQMSESLDQGLTWATREFNVPAWAICRNKAMKSDKMMTITSAAEFSTAHVSDDLGITWTSISIGTGVQSTRWTDIAVSSTGKYVRIDGYLVNYKNYVCYSADYGVSWTIDNREYYYMPRYGAMEFIGNSSIVLSVATTIGIRSGAYSSNVMGNYGSNNNVTGTSAGATITRDPYSNSLYIHTKGIISKWSGITTGVVIASAPVTTYGSLTINTNNDILVTGNQGAFLKKADTSAWVEVYGPDSLLQNIVSVGWGFSGSSSLSRIYTNTGIYETDGATVPYTFKVPDFELSGNYEDYHYVVGDIIE